MWQKVAFTACENILGLYLQVFRFAGVILCRTTTTVRTWTASSTMSPSFTAPLAAVYFPLRWSFWVSWAMKKCHAYRIQRQSSSFYQNLDCVAGRRKEKKNRIVQGDLVHLVACGALRQPGRICRRLLLSGHWNHIKDAQVCFVKFNQPNIGSYPTWYGLINGAMVNLSASCFSFLCPVFS